MKAVIPVAGAGKKLRPLTYTQPKPLIPVAGKPIICFIVDALVEEGIDEFVFIIGYLGEKIKNYILEKYPEITCTFVEQTNRLGSGHAIWLAKDFIDPEEEIVIFFGDTIVDLDLKSVLNSKSSIIGVKKVSDPRSFGVVKCNEKGIVTHLVEKPSIPLSNLALVGFYKIREPRLLFEGIEKNIEENQKTEGEFQLTDGLMRMVDSGVEISTIMVDNWFDCGKKEILLETNNLLLDRKGFRSENLPSYDNSIIIQPVNIGQDCEISNSIIGPHVTIGNNTKLESAIVKSSIIGNYASIKEAVLVNSVIGNDTSITGLRQSLNIGDNTEIDFR